jgi:hypothetical protein
MTDPPQRASAHPLHAAAALVDSLPMRTGRDNAGRPHQRRHASKDTMHAKQQPEPVTSSSTWLVVFSATLAGVLTANLITLLVARSYVEDTVKKLEAGYKQAVEQRRQEP